MKRRKKNRSGVNKKRRVGPAKRRISQVQRAIADRQTAAANHNARAKQELNDAVERALQAVTPEDFAAVNADPRLARAVNEEAAVRAAAEYGVNIRKANGKIDMRLARKAAEAAAIQSAAELGVDIRNQSGGISRRKALEAARLADAARSGADVDPQVKAAVDRQDRLLADAVREAQQRGLSLSQLTGDQLGSDPELARQVAEEMVILRAAEIGIDIYLDSGEIDPEKARQVRDISAAHAAAEVGIDIINARGKISRRKAVEAAKVADAARSGKPVSDAVRDAVSRQDARMMAALRAVQRRDGDPNRAAGPGGRREAYDDAELASLLRGHIDRNIR